MDVVAGLEVQLGLFFQAVLLGAVMVFLYDLLRIIRRVFLHGIIWISVEDFFYWLAVSVYFFLRLCQVNDGIIRAFIVLGMVFGAWLYYLLFSRHFMRWLSGIIFLVKKKLKKWQKLVTIRIKKLKRPKKSEESETENE